MVGPATNLRPNPPVRHSGPATIGRNCRYFSFRASVSRLGFAPRVSRLQPVAWIHLKYPIVRAPGTWQATRHPNRDDQSCTIALNCTTLELRFMFKLLFIANATRSRGTFGRSMVEYHWYSTTGIYHDNGTKTCIAILAGITNFVPLTADKFHS